MKLVLQIFLGVFLGTLASQFTFEEWRTYQENKAKEEAEKLRAERQKVYLDQAKRLRALMQNRRGNDAMPNMPPSRFGPNNDVKGQPTEQR